MIKRRVMRTGDGSHPLAVKAKEIEDDDDHTYPENPVWGWDDNDMTEDERMLAEITHKLG